MQSVRECRWHLTHGWSAWNSVGRCTPIKADWTHLAVTVGTKWGCNQLSSFCCLPCWVLWSQMKSVVAGVHGHLFKVSCIHQSTSPASWSFRSSAAKSNLHVLWPYCPLHLGLTPTKAVKALLTRECISMSRCVLECGSVILPCVGCFLCVCVTCSADQSCTNWVFMVRIQGLIPIMQTIKNLRRTVFYNLILK